MAKCSFLGLGVMGFPMAGWLTRAGHDVTVWNRSPAKSEKWVAEYVGKHAPTPLEAIEGADFIMMCLGDDPDVWQVFEAFQSGLCSGQIIVDHTTTSAAIAQKINGEAVKVGAAFIDAPISGGQAGAENGKLTVMAGATTDTFEKAELIMQAYSAKITHIGDVGTGQLCKSVNQICIAGIVQGLAEGLHFAMCAGLDTDKVLGAISGGAAQSWQMVNRGPTMVKGEYEFGFAVDWIRKDLRIALEEARKSGMTLPVTAIVDQFYADVQKMGGGRWDSSSLLARLNKKDPP